MEVVNGEGLDLGWGRLFQVRLDASLVGDAVKWLTRTREWVTEDDIQFDQVFQFAAALIFFSDVTVPVKPFEG